MNVPVTVNGVTVEIPVDDKVIQEALKKKQKKTGYERAKVGEYYYKDGSRPEFSKEQESISCYDDGYYSSANYYSDKNVSDNNIRADRLMRKLRRFAAEHGGAIAPYAPCGYSLYFNRITEKLACAPDICATAGAIRFVNVKSAETAITEFKDELIWYFTEYDPMPDGWWHN